MQMAMEIIVKQGVRGFCKLESGKKQKQKKGGEGRDRERVVKAHVIAFIELP
jgi:hypothetical protein